jgi:hypothetical protein
MNNTWQNCSVSVLLVQSFVQYITNTNAYVVHIDIYPVSDLADSDVWLFFYGFSMEIDKLYIRLPFYTANLE